MAPKQSTTSARGRGASSATTNKPSKASTSKNQSSRAVHSESDADPFAEDDRSQQRRGHDTTMEIDDDNEEEEDEEARKTIPPELLTHVLHQFFEKNGTRVSKDANAAIAKYMDIFVREAIARTVVEKEKGFLEVEDLEKVAPQLLLDL
ncbi:CENP-S associating centromere protein X-domain-containing protein [Hypoxylon trugodes]|uniref:CENP-S associating centromere protein X-domain-containing protein n=1 Tax=Hypoxylon trugodes TaxID=326681 RepID=UPI0021A094FD|nr:CENP-S associating centromere protein X-domain-containing protein [Hypoxylon trugodes]KAI1388704.1 CENP-S associating centromere protein X-domain-containing protein [Hypoxylon trugodes]